MGQNVLVVGKGAREHAVAWKLLQSRRVDYVFVAPGNAGTLTMDRDRCTNLPIKVGDVDAIRNAIEAKNIDLTIYGPEDPLIAGHADILRSHGHLVFGPGADGARLEGSKSFGKMIMNKYGIPTAQAVSVEGINQADTAVKRATMPVVIKADGLAAGKGVFICQTVEEGRRVVNQLMMKNLLGKAGHRLVIEEFLQGPEASLHVVTDGKTFRVLALSRDHKREFDGDKGRNTGGMGAYAPLPDQSWLNSAIKTIVRPLLAALKAEGIKYRGVIYIGLILTKDGPKVLEFNCRFGDPETQVILPLLQSDLYELCDAAARGTLSSIKPLIWYPGYATGVALVSGGYPGTIKTGKPITGLPLVSPDTTVFHAGTRYENGQVLTDGGRVLTVVGRGSTLDLATAVAYNGVKGISFEEMAYRKDIAQTN
ncbi:MAG: phosphoribosylamine--glycine ligase [Patescibacteria group bacterium]